MNENMEFPELSGSDIEWLQDQLVATVMRRREEDVEDRRVAKEDKGKVRTGTLTLNLDK